jgi:hypothetical protein
MGKFYYYFHVYNSNITNNTINVLGYHDRWHRVMAHDVYGGLRIGFVSRHQCDIFAFGFFFGVRVLGVNASSSGSLSL